MVLSDLTINLLMETHSEKIKQKKELAEMMERGERRERDLDSKTSLFFFLSTCAFHCNSPMGNTLRSVQQSPLREK